MNRGLAWLVFPLLAACGPKPSAEEGGGRLSDTGGDGETGEGGGGGVASGEVGRAIDDAKDALADLDARLERARDAGSDDAVVLAQDRIALASFLAHLERCAADETQCPPRLDEPELPSEYDVPSGELKGAFGASADEWPDAAKTIAANACACRTRACTSWILAELERWTIALSAKDLDAAAEDETRARECVHARIHGE
jgi:hypothetical protein